jgi:hypothetical protein
MTKKERIIEKRKLRNVVKRRKEMRDFRLPPQCK